jgi:hypothetical protein
MKRWNIYYRVDTSTVTRYFLVTADSKEAARIRAEKNFARWKAAGKKQNYTIIKIEPLELFKTIS